MAVFRHQVLGAGAFAKEVAILGVGHGAAGHGFGALVEYSPQLVAEHDLQGRCNGGAGAVHAHAMCLHHGHVAVHVDNQAGQAIALGVHQPKHVGVGRAGKAQALAQGVGIAELGLPKGRAGQLGFGAEIEHPHGNGAAAREVAHAQQLAVDGLHPHGVAFVGFAQHAGNGPRKHPRVAAA